MVMSFKPEWREKAIDALVEDDFNSIMHGDAIELLNSYLEFGHRGYRDYTDDELSVELQQRDIILTKELDNA
jgi:hypothetical protein